MAKHTKLNQIRNQQALKHLAVDLLKSIPLAELLERARPADKLEESRYIDAWNAANKLFIASGAAYFDKPMPNSINIPFNFID